MKSNIYLISLLFIFTICIQLTVKAQQFEWAKKFGHENTTKGVKQIHTGQDGNIYMTGTYNTYIAFGPDTLTGGRFFIAKLDKNGNPLMARDVKGAMSAAGITTDGQGDIIAAGSFSGTITINGQTYSSAGSSDIIIIKYNAAGNITWVKTFGSQETESSTSIATDAAGNIYLTGDYRENTTLGNFTVTTQNRYKEIFITKLSPAGEPLWVKHTTRKSNASFTDILSTKISTDPQGNSYLSFAFNNNEITFDGKVIKSNDINGSNVLLERGHNIVIAKFNTNGQLSWLKQGAGFATNYNYADPNNSNEYVKCAAAPNGEVYIAATNFPGHDYVIFDKDSFASQGINIMKLSATGDIIWRKTGGSLVVGSYLKDFVADKKGNIYGIGHHQFPSGNPDEQYYLGEDTAWVSYSPSLYIFKMDSAGNNLYLKYAGGDKTVLAIEVGNTIAADDEGNAYIAGTFGYGNSTNPRPFERIMYFDSHSLIAPKNKYQPEMFVAKIPGCGDDTLVVNATGKSLTASTTGATYQWYYNGQRILNDTLRTMEATASGLYSVRVTQVNGCKAYSPAYNYKAPIPKINAGFTANNVCAGKNITFTNISTADVTPLTYNWSFGDGNTSTDISPVHRFASAGTYNVRLIASIPSQNADTFSSVITVFATPSANFTTSINGKEVRFTPADTTLAFYEWNFGDGNTSALPKPVHTYANEGRYQVILDVRNSNDCETVFADSVFVKTTGITAYTTIAEDISLNLYPNPFNEQAHITYKLEKATKVKISIYNIQGKEIAVITEATQSPGNYTFPLNAETANMSANGIYLLRVTLDDAVITKQLIRLK